MRFSDSLMIFPIYHSATDMWTDWLLANAETNHHDDIATMF